MFSPTVQTILTMMSAQCYVFYRFPLWHSVDYRDMFSITNCSILDWIYKWDSVMLCFPAACLSSFHQPPQGHSFLNTPDFSLKSGDWGDWTMALIFTQLCTSQRMLSFPPKGVSVLLLFPLRGSWSHLWLSVNWRAKQCSLGKPNGYSISHFLLLLYRRFMKNGYLPDILYWSTRTNTRLHVFIRCLSLWLCQALTTMWLISCFPMYSSFQLNCCYEAFIDNQHQCHTK